MGQYLRKSIQIFLAFSLFLCFSMFYNAAVYAKPDAEKPSAIQETFDVGKYLKIGEGAAGEVKGQEGQKQGQKYFEEAGELGGKLGQPVSPVAAFIIDLINFLVKIIATVSLLIFITGALLTIVSEGKEDRLEKGKTAMIYSAIGLVLALVSYFIASFVQSIFF